MSAALALLHARRTAPAGAVAVVAASALIARRLAPTGESFGSELAASPSGGAQAAWTIALLLAAILVLLRAAGTPDRWLTDEGDWVGASATGRVSLVTSTLAGLGAGCVLFVLSITAAVAAGGSRGPAEDAGLLLERTAVAGPMRSVVLQPGEVFDQSLAGRPLRAGSTVRVRVTATFGGETPTTDVRIGAGAATRTQNVARRTWIEADAVSDAAVRLENCGTGALAVLGPSPVEVWEPSTAWLGGHLRVGLHATLLLVTLAALSFAFGCTMGPVVAALFALSFWLGAQMLTQGSAAGAWVPGAAGLAGALDAVHLGRAPRPPAPSTYLSAALVAAASIGFARLTLRTWRQELRE